MMVRIKCGKCGSGYLASLCGDYGTIWACGDCNAETEVVRDKLLETVELSPQTKLLLVEVGGLTGDKLYAVERYHKDKLTDVENFGELIHADNYIEAQKYIWRHPQDKAVMKCPECFSDEIHTGGPYSEDVDTGELTACHTCGQCDNCWEE